MRAPPRAPGATAVPASISGDAELWRVIRSIQRLRDNEGTKPAEVFHLIAEMVEAAAVVALRETDATFEQLIVEILRMIGEGAMADLIQNNWREFQHRYAEGKAAFDAVTPERPVQ